MTTATTTLPAIGTGGPPESVPYRLTADEFFQMIELGIIPTKRRVGLWEGQLYEKMAKTLAHAVSTSKLATALLHVLPGGWCLWSENPILLDTARAPLPDLTVLRGAHDDYFRRRRVPTADDVGVVIEVSESSYRQDIGPMLEGYARALLPVYWVVNLQASRVEVYSHPEIREPRAVYSALQTYGLDEEVPLVLDGQEVARIAVRALVPTDVA